MKTSLKPAAVLTAAALALVSALAAGCSRGRGVPPPPAAGDAEVLAAWCAITNSGEVVRTFGNVGGRLLAPGAVALRVDFAKRPPRASWDARVPCDLAVRPGIQFDFCCTDLEQFSSFSCYFKSGDGWYSGSFSPEESGKWERMTVLKASCHVEGNPDGWDKVSAIRISGWRAGEGKAECAVANVAAIGSRNPDVLVVYADSLAKKEGTEAGYMKFGGTVASSLAAIGVEATLVADVDLTAESARAAKAIVLPYNTSFPSGKLPILKEYVDRGGRLLVCYTSAPEICGLVGVKVTGVARPSDGGGASIAGFLKAGKGLDGQPGFAPQSSWITCVVAPSADAEVVAEWCDGAGASLRRPALVRTARGLFMSHVWLGGVEGASAQLMKAIACDLSPELRGKIAARDGEVRERRRRDAEWLASLPSKKGEWRGFWCHSARGVGGGKNWDASIRLLKENGFNAILPNLCWGGVAFYDSAVLPKHSDVAARGDAFKECMAACRKYGVECHVWKVCWNMGSHTAKSFEEAMVASNRVQTSFSGAKKTRWLCPSHPDNRRLEIEAMVELAKKRPDGIHYDYIRYPDSATCFCDGCRARFEAAVGEKVADWPGAVRKDDRLRRAWRDFRVGCITEVVKSVAERVRREAPGVKISAATFRNPETDPREVAQDWASWCREGYLDFVCNMDYVESSAMFRSQVRRQARAVGKAKVYPGIGLSTWMNDGGDAVRLARQIMVARDLGLGGFTVFNFDSRAERALPLLRLGVTKED